MEETTQGSGNEAEARRGGLKTLVIKGSEWLRGEGGAPSRLLRLRDGKKCCLGILALACGFVEEEIREVIDPFDVASRSRWPFVVDLHITGINKAMSINDTTPRNSDLSPCGDEGHINSDNERIRRLRPILEKWGYEIDWRPNE